MLSKALLAAALASSATAFLLPPQMDMESAMNEVKNAKTNNGQAGKSDNMNRHHRVGQYFPHQSHAHPTHDYMIGSVPCPGCPVTVLDPRNPAETAELVTSFPSHLQFAFLIDHAESGDRVFLNDYELYPNVGLSGEALMAQQRPDSRRMAPPHRYSGPPIGGPGEGHRGHREHEEKEHKEHKEHKEPKEHKELKEEEKEKEQPEEPQELKRDEEKEPAFPSDTKKLKSHVKFPGVAAWSKGKHGEHKTAEEDDLAPPPPHHGRPSPPPDGHHRLPYFPGFPAGRMPLVAIAEDVPLGYLMQRSEVHFNNTNLVILSLQVNSVRNTEIQDIPAVIVTLSRTPSGGLVFQSVQTMDHAALDFKQISVGTVDVKAAKLAQCTNSICRWLVKLGFHLKSQGCGGNRASKEGKEAEEGKEAVKGVQGMEMDGNKDAAGSPPPVRPHHHHHHHSHSHHHPPFHGMREHSWGQMLKKFSSHILVPVLIGIAAGIMVSFVGMLVGSVLVSVWRMLFRRGSSSSRACSRRQARQHRHHHRHASKAAGRETGDTEEKAGLMAAAETEEEAEEALPPYKEDVEEVVVVVVKETTEEA